MNENNTLKNRIAFVDGAKGITMLLVIFAHTLTGEGISALLRGIVYSFHMPLFFILSGYTMKPSKDFQAFVKKKLVLAKKLLLPGVLLFFAWIVIEVLRGYGSISDFEYIKSKLITLLFASANSRECYGIFINGIGMIWFFFVLYGGRALYDFIAMSTQKIAATKVQNKVVSSVAGGGICLCVSIIGILIGNHYWLPFSFDISMAVVLFFFLGDLLKLDDMKKNKLIKLALAILIWVILFYVTYPHLSDWTYLEVGLRRYSLYPLSFICALAATYGLCQVCDMVGERFLKPFIYLGKHSMILLCVHIMDQLWDFVWFYEKNQYITFLLRVASDLLVFVLISLIIGKMPKKNLKK